MDWDFAIERNREDLLPVILGLFAMIGLSEGGMVERLSRPVYRKAVRLLRSAEAAVRRLIIVAARDIVVEPRPKRSMPAGLVRSRKGTFQGKGYGRGQAKEKREGKSRPSSFNLFDPQKRSDAGRPRQRRRRKGSGAGPRVRVLGYDPRIPWFLRGPDPTPAPVAESKVTFKDGTVSAKRLCRRLFAILRALTNMEREAKRYALWLARPKEDRRPRRERALRFGWPPGWRVRPTHDVHRILKECHWLIHELPQPDTS